MSLRTELKSLINQQKKEMEDKSKFKNGRQMYRMKVNDWSFDLAINDGKMANE
jgi:hypothetical protein